MKKLVFFVSFVCVVMSAYGIEAAPMNDEEMLDISLPTQVTEPPKVAEEQQSEEAITEEDKKLSIKADSFSSEGYSEAELEMGNTALSGNGVEAPNSRYGVGLKLNYAIKSNSRLKFEIFASNGLEINTQRRGGKVKSYDDGVRSNENAYNYGNMVAYSGWVNSIGMTLTILKTHRLMLTFKQTQLSNNDAYIAMGGAPQGGGAMWLGEHIASNDAMRENPWSYTTQIFLTYSYVF